MSSSQDVEMSDATTPAQLHDDLSALDLEPEPVLKISIHLHNKPIELPFYSKDATIQDLSDEVAEDHHIPPANQKFLISPKVGLLKPPFKDPGLLLQTLQEKKIVLIGATTAEVEELESDIADRRARIERRKAAQDKGRKIKANTTRDWKKEQDAVKYRFHMIKPLDYLPNPERSQRFLEMLANDAGIKYAMRKHGFAVGLLTEMNPVEHTTRESRTLGLNRNAGEVIELRLRTDAYDGYRDYKVIRKTLCHELTHNVWGDHDRNFWDLCKEIEKEVEENDWRRGGHHVGKDEFFNPHDAGVEDEDAECDHGGWTGGEFVLGGLSAGGEGASGTGGEVLSRRDIMAKAAEERAKMAREAKEAEKKAKDGSSGAK